MDDFYAARTNTMPALPWPNLQPPYTEVLADEMPKRTTDEWLKTFARLDVPHSRVSTLQDLLEDEHLNAVRFFEPTDGMETRARSVPQPVRVRGAGHSPDRAAPGLGADTTDILTDIGYSETQLADLSARGVIGGRA